MQASDRLTVLYDDQCGLCTRSRTWLEKQKTVCPIEFRALSDPDLSVRYPHLQAELAARPFLVILNDHRVYADTEARLLCLHTVEKYRRLAQRLAAPAYYPWVDRIFRVVATHRLRLSRLLGLRAETCLQGECHV